MRRMNVPLAHLGSMDYVPHLIAHLYSNGNRTCGDVPCQLCYGWAYSAMLCPVSSGSSGFGWGLGGGMAIGT